MHGRNGSNILASLGDTETEARTKLYQLIETWKDQLFPHRFSGVNLDSSESRIPDIVQENQQSVKFTPSAKIESLELDLNKVTTRKTNEGWKATIKSCDGCEIAVVSALGDTETDAKSQLYQN